MTVTAIATLGRGSVSVVVAISRSIVRVLLVLRVGCVILGMDGLLPDLARFSGRGSGTLSASDDATSKDSGVAVGLIVKCLASSRDPGGIDIKDEDSSSDKGVGTTEIHEQFFLDRGVIDASVGFVARNVGNLASFRVSIWVDNTIPLLLQRVEDFTKGFVLLKSVAVLQAIENTIICWHISRSVDVKSDGASCSPSSTGVLDISPEGCRSMRVLRDLNFTCLAAGRG